MGSVVPPFVGRRSINTFGRKLSMFENFATYGSGLTPRLSNQKITFKKPPETRKMFRLTRLCVKRKHNYRQSGQELQKKNHSSKALSYNRSQRHRRDLEDFLQWLGDERQVLQRSWMYSPPCFTPTPRGFHRAFSKKSTSSRATDQTVAAAAAAAATPSLPGRRASLIFHSLSVPSYCLDFGRRRVNESILSGLIIFLFLNVPLVITPPPTPPPPRKPFRQTAGPAFRRFNRSQRGATHIFLLRAGAKQPQEV